MWLVVIAVLALFHGAFGLALWRKDNSLADVVWGIGFMVAAYTAVVVSGGGAARAWLLLVLVTAWGARLAGHIFTRNRGKGEDPRYQAWRRDWGSWWVVRSYLQVFLLQAIILLVVALPLWQLPFLPVTPLTIWDGMGLVIWLIGFGFETIGDAQLASFKKLPSSKGQLMTTGLWRYTRHPNYFGEATMWWGIAVMAAAGGLGWLSLISPITITFLLTKVSGIPLLEKRYQGRADFEAYRRQTSAFFPWFPRQ